MKVLQKYKSVKSLNISAKGLDMIKKLEGYRDKAFWDYKRYSIGYGTRALSKNEIITEEEASRRLVEDINDVYILLIRDHVQVQLTNNMLDALVSLVYNVGADCVSGSLLIKELNNSNYYNASNAMLEWCHAGGQVNPSLVKRRIQESKLFMTDL